MRSSTFNLVLLFLRCLERSHGIGFVSFGLPRKCNVHSNIRDFLAFLGNWSCQLVSFLRYKEMLVERCGFSVCRESTQLRVT